MDQPIAFGTDGWRAVIADGFTFENLGRVAQATAYWLGKTYGEAPSVVMGHDTRFMGRAFAEHVACVLASYGVRVLFAETFVPTQAVSWATLEYGADAGIVITASHNPPEYNGFKIKADFGGPVLPEVIADVEAELARLTGEPPPRQSFVHSGHTGLIEVRDIKGAYLEMLRRKLDLDAIVASGLKIAHDAMYGAGQGVVATLLGAEHVVEVRNEVNPGFHGEAPEPIERRLSPLVSAVVEERCDVGLANDGDADRLGMVDETGRFVTSHQLLALLTKYLHKTCGLHGKIVKTVSTTHMLDKMGLAYGLPVETTPIGFKYIASLIIDGDVLVGGEESGGIAVTGHLPERDGLYIGLLVLEMMVACGKKLSELVQELFDEFGPHHYHRVDVHTTEEKKQAALKRLKDEGGLAEIAGRAVERLDTLDGYKHLMTKGWLLVRASGTEPVLRIYAEAPSDEAARALVEDAVAQLGV